MRVFLSYRREDAGGHAGRLADALVQRLGARGVFHDVVAIAPGQDFMQVIDDALGTLWWTGTRDADDDTEVAA